MLTRREREVFHEICDSDDVYKGVGERLGISRETVKNHASRILRKLGWNTIPKACYEYGRKGRHGG